MICTFCISVKPAYFSIVRNKALSSADRKKVAMILRGLRTKASLNQTDLARLLGKPQSFVSRYEASERRLDLVELREVCNALGITLQAFVAEFEDKR